MKSIVTKFGLILISLSLVLQPGLVRAADNRHYDSTSLDNCELDVGYYKNGVVVPDEANLIVGYTYNILTRIASTADCSDRVSVILRDTVQQKDIECKNASQWKTGDGFRYVEWPITIPDQRIGHDVRFFGKNCGDQSYDLKSIKSINSQPVPANQANSLSFNCDRQLYFVNNNNNNAHFAGTATVGLDAKISLEAKVEKCTNATEATRWWRVTMSKDGQYVKTIIPVRSVSGTKADYPPAVPLQLDSEGTYDFYLDYSTKSGKDADLKDTFGQNHITIIVKKDGSSDGGGFTPGEHKPYAVDGSVNYDTVYARLGKLTKFNNIPQLLANSIQAVILLMGVIAVLMIVIGSIRMIISQGNTERLAAAKKTVLWAVLGLVVAIMAFSMVAILETLIGVQSL